MKTNTTYNVLHKTNVSLIFLTYILERLSCHQGQQAKYTIEITEALYYEMLLLIG